jgi:protein associated with RNAse G/E
MDGTEHRRWRAQLAHRADALLVLDATFAAEIQHELLGTIKPGTISREYYWLDRWYNVFRFVEPTGELRNFYCNINVPPKFDGRRLCYIDLDLDVLVWPDFSYMVLDEDEFRTNAARFAYTRTIIDQALRARDELIALIEGRAFPFSFGSLIYERRP